MTREEIILTVSKEIFIKWVKEGWMGGDRIGDEFKKLTKKVEEALDSIKK